MPWVSAAQRKWGHTAAGKQALGGESAVHEWDEATGDTQLPEKVKWPGSLTRAKNKVLHGNYAS